MSPSAIFHLYRNGQFYCRMKPERKKTPDLPQVTDSEKASSLQLSDNLVLNVQLSHYRIQVAKPVIHKEQFHH